MKGRQITQNIRLGHEAIYRVIRELKDGNTAIEIYFQYKKNKQKCGRKPIQLPQDEIDYINDKVDEEWTPDVIIYRKERHISCGMKTLYRMFERGVFCQDKLPMKGKRKPNGHQEKKANKLLDIPSKNVSANVLLQLSQKEEKLKILKND